MSHRRPRRSSSYEARTESRPPEVSSERSAHPRSTRRISNPPRPGARPSQKWSQLYGEDEAPIQCADLTRLIELDAPLQHNSGLVLMYGPFQTEMVPSAGLGVASWLKDCLHKHGVPSLLRYDYHRRAQVLRRDQFQGLISTLIGEKASV